MSTRPKKLNRTSRKIILEVDNLEVELQEDSVCVLRSQCDCKDAKEKTILMAGNMKGVSSVVAVRLKIADSKSSEHRTQSGNSNEEQADSEFEQSSSSQYYTIESGDTLWGIAAKFLGNGSKYPEIFEANREIIEDPDKIFVGQKIRIPSSS